MANLEANIYVQNSSSGYDKLNPTSTAEKIAYTNTTSGLSATDTQLAIDELASEKAPTSHASTLTVYGVGSTTNYGHCKTINNLTSSSYVDGEALSAYQGKLLNDSLNTVSTGTITQGSYFTLFQYAWLKKKGNYCSLGISGTITSGITKYSEVVIATVPSGFRPVLDDFSSDVTLFSTGDGSTCPARITVTMTGNVTLYLISSAMDGKFFKLTLNYVV